jgi:hypothetical protein
VKMQVQALLPLYLTKGPMYKYDTERRDYPTSTPLMEIRPDAVRVLNVSSGTMTYYQHQMSKAIWRPAPGRKLGFLVMQDESLLGLIFLASPVIRLGARDEYLFPNAPKDFNYGLATKEYMDMSVCVAAQPIGWHWNLGKLMALIAPALGDYVEERYPNDTFKGITTTSLWGRSVQYNRIYKFLGYTKGFGHQHIGDEEYKKMLAILRENCEHCADPVASKDPSRRHECLVPSTRFGDGANARARRINAYRKFAEDKTVKTFHGVKRGVYFHAAVPPEQRPEVIQRWYERWGLPRYERTKDQSPPYTDGLDGREAWITSS